MKSFVVLKVFYSENRYKTVKMLSQSCKRKGVNVSESEECSDHARMSIDVLVKTGVVGFAGFTRGKKSFFSP